MTKEDMKRALQPIARGLFGKQGTNRYQRPVFTPYPLETILADLTAIPPPGVVSVCIFAGTLKREVQR